MSRQMLCALSVSHGFGDAVDVADLDSPLDHEVADGTDPDDRVDKGQDVPLLPVQ